jgi:hypothetical protein
LCSGYYRLGANRCSYCCQRAFQQILEANVIAYHYSFAIVLHQLFRASPTWLSAFPVLCFILPSFKLAQACSCLSPSISIATACVRAHHVTSVRLAFILHVQSSQHQNHLPVDRHSMPKRRPDPAHDLCNSCDESVLLTGSHSPPRAPTAALARGVEQARCLAFELCEFTSGSTQVTLSHFTKSASWPRNASLWKGSTMTPSSQLRQCCNSWRMSPQRSATIFSWYSLGEPLHVVRMQCRDGFRAPHGD